MKEKNVCKKGWHMGKNKGVCGYWLECGEKIQQQRVGKRGRKESSTEQQ